MKELMATARNTVFLVNDEKETIESMIEGVLTLSEPVFREVPGVGCVQIRETEAMRFHTSPVGLRGLAEACQTWADEAEDTAKRMSIERGET